MQPHNAICSYRKIGSCEHVRPKHRKNIGVDERPQRFHEIEYKRRSPRLPGMFARWVLHATPLRQSSSSLGH